MTTHTPTEVSSICRGRPFTRYIRKSSFFESTMKEYPLEEVLDFFPNINPFKEYTL